LTSRSPSRTEFWRIVARGALHSGDNGSTEFTITPVNAPFRL